MRLFRSCDRNWPRFQEYRPSTESSSHSDRRTTQEPISIGLRSLDTSSSQSPVLETRLRQLPGLQDVTSDLQIKNPQVNVEINRDKASALGVTAQQIEDALASAYSSRQISTILPITNTGHPGIGAAISDGPFGSFPALYSVDERSLGSSKCRSDPYPKVRPSDGQPSRPTPGGDHFFQSQTRRTLGGCHKCGPKDRSSYPPTDHQHQLSRNSPGLPIFDSGA